MQNKVLQWILYSFNIATTALLVYDLGVLRQGLYDAWVDIGYFSLTAVTLALTVYRNKRQIHPAQRDRFAVWALSVILVPCTLAALRNAAPALIPVGPYAEQAYLVLIFLYLLYALSRATRLLYSGAINAMVLFAGSFLIVILLGSFLLTLPQATTKGISYIDALFTATSAVSVTGLAVVDTGTAFTFFGQVVVLLLIQIGGLGILTFTSFFAYFFRSGSSFREGMAIRDMISSDTLGNVLELAAKIVGFTLSIELAGALLIFWSTGPFATGLNMGERAFFSVFHSVASFCNAGFSTMTNNLYEGAWRFNYGMQWIIALLLIFGGLGFNIIFNSFLYIKTFIKKLADRIIRGNPIIMPVRIITLNARIVLTTTGILLLSGTILFFFSEYRNALAEHSSWFGKLTTAFFMSVTPRTGGFNTVDYAALTLPTLLFTILFMWIGASPASTGGGIKTTTFALATLNILAIARGKRRIELASRQISSLAVNRAFAILCLSLIMLGFSILAVSYFDPQLGLMKTAFECFSALGTVGLSMNVTPTLSAPSKIVIILTMYVGRIGAINILVGMLRQINTEYYHYPKEDIVIN